MTTILRLGLWFALTLFVAGQGQELRPAPSVVVGGPKVDIFPMYFPDAQVEDVADFYEELTGSKVLVEGVYGTVFISVPPMPKARCIEVIEETLFAAGYAIIELEPGTIRILEIGDKVAERKLPIITKLADLPTSERIVAYEYRPRSRQPAEFAAVLNRIYAKGTTGIPAIIPEEKENTIRITARTSALRNMLKLMSELDPSLKK